jgi:hypothetical protein
MTQEAVSPLRRRMIEDMSVRSFASETERNYIGAVKNLAILSADRPTKRTRSSNTNSEVRACPRCPDPDEGQLLFAGGLFSFIAARPILTPAAVRAIRRAKNRVLGGSVRPSGARRCRRKLTANVRINSE